jgi:hypothetical protein
VRCAVRAFTETSGDSLETGVTTQALCGGPIAGVRIHDMTSNFRTPPNIDSLQ